jgi:hypothetical protein
MYLQQGDGGDMLITKVQARRHRMMFVPALVAGGLALGTVIGGTEASALLVLGSAITVALAQQTLP